MFLVLTALLAFIHASRASSDVSVGFLGPNQGTTITSQISSASLGGSVRGAGDFNGDGYYDIIVGSYGANGNTGAIYVVFGGPKGLSDLDISSGMTASKGMVVSGASMGNQLGYSVSNAGDVNGDGIDDIIIGANLWNGGKGAAYVIYGSKTPPAVIYLASGLTSNQGFSVIGSGSTDNLGASVSYAGDVNNDKIDDVIIGASGFSNSRGAAYVIFGKKGTRNSIDMSSGLSPSDGFAILGVSDNGNFGKSVSSAGDLDGDGIGDLVIGAPGANFNDGVSYFIYGKPSSSTFATLDLSQGLTLSQGFSLGGASTSRFGSSVSGVGDFNGDGKADVIIGAYKESSKGAAYVFFGNDRSSLVNVDLNSQVLDPSRGVRIGEINNNADFGMSVSGAGDINNDGFDDIIIGSQGASGNTGAAYVIFGSKTFGSLGVVPSSGLGPNEGFRVFGTNTNDYLGASVSYAGDVNGDGMPDVIVGASGVSSSKGAAYILFSPLICPERCETCSTTKKCLSCKAGYGLLDFICLECPAKTELQNGLCITPSETSLETATEMAKGLFDVGSTASRIFTMGRSLSVSLGLIAKIIQNVRFLDVKYPEETVNVFKTYGTDLFELPIPQVFYESPETKELPSQYSRYDMEPSFLENYWDTIMMILISLTCFLLIKLLQFLTKSQDKEGLFQVVLAHIAQTAANFFIIQIYSSLDDVIFYLLLDIQSTYLSSPSAGVSLGVAIVFLLIGVALVFFHCRLLSKYQKAKSQGALDRFEAKYRVLGTLYEDFKDTSIAKQSFFGILIFRCVILVLVIQLFRPQWMQATILMLINLVFVVYLVYHRPFKSLFDEITQYFCELTVFAAYLCVLILSILDAQDIQKSGLRSSLGKCIVTAGVVLALGGFIIQVIQIIGAVIGICKFVKNYNNRKQAQVIKLDQSRDTNTASRLSENSAILKHPSPINLGDQIGFLSVSGKTRRRIYPENLGQDALEGPSLDKEGLVCENKHSMKAGHWVNMPNKEEEDFKTNLQVVLRPLGSRIYRGNREGGPLNPDTGLKPMGKSPFKRRKIKRNHILPNLNDV